MEAIVLAGGLGTRLRRVINEIPKPMAPINGRPFLSYILNYLNQSNITKVILSTGYKHEIIESYYGGKYKNIELIYSIEDEALGTGGAIKKALTLTKEENVFILNGDTFFNVDLLKLLAKHDKTQSTLTLSLKPLIDFNRYGTVETFGDRIINFNEKKFSSKGNINGGIYICRNNLFNNKELPSKFSFEKDYLEPFCSSENFYSLIQDQYFIDIGMPEDYKKAQSELLPFYEE